MNRYDQYDQYDEYDEYDQYGYPDFNMQNKQICIKTQRGKGHSHNGVFQSLFRESMLFLQDETQDAMRKLDNGSFHLNTCNFFCGLGRASILKTCNLKTTAFRNGNQV